MMITFLYLAVRYHRSRILLHRRQVIAEISSIEKERKRIAADLHDEIGSLLTYVKLKLSNMEMHCRLSDDISAVRQKLNSMHDSLLAITNDLLPNSLERNGLLQTIEEYLHETGGQLGITVCCTIDMKLERHIAQPMKIHLYRVVIELVQNTIKHAAATRLSLSLNLTKNHLELHYADNGKGIDPRKDLQRNAGLGLRNINSRVEMLGGRLFLDSTKNKGVNYIIQIPAYATTH
jgi:signal transduction histidine kinase